MIAQQQLNNEHYIQDKPTEIHGVAYYEELTDIVKSKVEPLEVPTFEEIKPVEQVAVPEPKAAQTSSTSVSRATAPSGWFPKSQCTWLVWTKRPVGLWNDATDWLWQAKRDGWATGSEPRAGAIGWEYGHVVYIEKVNGDGTVTITEANYDRRGSIRTIDRPASRYTYIY